MTYLFTLTRHRGIIKIYDQYLHLHVFTKPNHLTAAAASQTKINQSVSQSASIQSALGKRASTCRPLCPRFPGPKKDISKTKKPPPPAEAFGRQNRQPNHPPINLSPGIGLGQEVSQVHFILQLHASVESDRPSRSGQVRWVRWVAVFWRRVEAAWRIRWDKPMQKPQLARSS